MLKLFLGSLILFIAYVAYREIKRQKGVAKEEENFDDESIRERKLSIKSKTVKKKIDNNQKEAKITKKENKNV